MTLNDNELPIEGFWYFFLNFWLQRISTVNCDEMAGNRPNNLHMKLSALNVDFSSSSSDSPG